MHLLKPFIVISFLCLLTFSLRAEESDSYNGPGIQWKQRDVKAAEVKKDKWDQNFHYKVEENPYNKRGIASDPEELSPRKYDQGRDPSSTSLEDPLKFEFQEDVRKWKWNQEKE